MKTARLIAGICVLAGSLAAAAAAPDQIYGFAEELLADGDEAFALLEFKRFIHHHPQDPRSPDAMLQIAMVYLTYAGDVSQARQTLRNVAEKYPKAKAAAQAKDLQTFMEVNSDFEGKPLVAFLRAKRAENRGRFGEAAVAYLDLANNWPTARLAEQALLVGAKLQLHQLNKPKEAKANFNTFVARHPKSRLRPEAQYEAAAAVEKLHGPGKEALAAFRAVAAANPKSAFGAKAAARAAEIAKAANILKRRFGQEFVRKFEVISEGGREPNQHTVVIQVSPDLSQRELQATLEDALLKHYEKRKTEKHQVRIKAYFNYPITKAGKAIWLPGRDPVYEVEERKTEDVLKDVFFDLLKKKRK